MSTRCLRLALMLLASTVLTAAAQTARPTTASSAQPQAWQAGTCVDSADVARNGTSAYFHIDTISDALFARMWRRSYKADCSIPRSALRYLRLLHTNAEGQTLRGELVCNVAIAADLLDIFRQLYLARYPIERMQLIDDFDANDAASMQANNTSCFNFRRVAGSSVLSLHAQGRAVDLNPFYNPWVRRRANGTTDVQPPSARRYADRSQRHAYVLRAGDLAHRLFTERGFKWGGAWRSSKDYQHFEK